VRDYDSEYSKKRYIQNLMRFCEEKGRYRDSLLRQLWYCYGLCFGRISPFKITNALSIYREFKPTHVLDPFAGFGGRMAAAMIAGVDYTGYDTNVELKRGYEQLKREMGKMVVSGQQEIHFQDSSVVDFRSISLYDMVLTSPPYDNTEIYPHQPYRTISEWDTFYNIVFTSAWDGLVDGGVYAINISSAIYERVLKPLIGNAHEERILKKSSRNSYQEMIYIWKK
jgi:tRNA G10  N-methylase Trm11